MGMSGRSVCRRIKQLRKKRRGIPELPTEARPKPVVMGFHSLGFADFEPRTSDLGELENSQGQAPGRVAKAQEFSYALADGREVAGFTQRRQRWA